MNPPPSPPEDDPPNPEPAAPPARDLLAEFQKAVEECAAIAGDNIEQLEAAGMNLLILAMQQAQENPSPDNEWSARIEACEATFDWEAAIAVRRDYIAWKRDRDPHSVWKPLMDLANLLWMCGKTSEAATVSMEALDVAKQSDMSVAPLMAAPLAACHAAALGRMAEAQQIVDDALMAPVESGGEFFSRRSGLPLRLCQARLAVHGGELILAEHYLEEIWPDLEPSGDSTLLAGLRSRHAEFASITGELHVARGESTLAAEAFARALQHRQAVSQMGHAAGHSSLIAVAKAKLRLADVTEQTEPDAAARLREQARAQFESLRVPAPPPA